MSTASCRSSSTATCPRQPPTAADDQGQIRLWAGNIAVHVIDVAFVRRMSQIGRGACRFIAPSRKSPSSTRRAQQVEPAEPNATKFERFIFDLLPAAENAFVVESLPSEAFAPVKNAERIADGHPRTGPNRRSSICIEAGWNRPVPWSTRGSRSRLTPDFRYHRKIWPKRSRQICKSHPTGILTLE